MASDGLGTHRLWRLAVCGLALAINPLFQLRVLFMTRRVVYCAVFTAVAMRVRQKIEHLGLSIAKPLQNRQHAYVYPTLFTEKGTEGKDRVRRDMETEGKKGGGREEGAGRMEGGKDK